MDLAALARRPLVEQCAALDALIGHGLPDGVLLTLAGWPDPAPLAHALERLLERSPEVAPLPAALAAALAAASDAHLGRVLRGLPAEGCPEPAREALIDRVAAAIEALPTHRVAAACFLLRWIDRADPDRGRRSRSAAVHAAEEAIADGVHVPAQTFLRLPGAAYAALEAHAEAAGRGSWWRGSLGAHAADMLIALEAQPKSLSQVGAEALLSRKVYTDPAHFLMELIQNAEDADAGQWALTVEHERLVVEHDGTPFDARDVVGVLSIGQTTKSGARIGFFGVGFKSVYAVTDRPRITSGPFDFEIADVSLPRLIEGRPDGLGTRLELPLRAPDDARTGWRVIGRRAQALPSTLLLTLRHIHRLQITVDGVCRVVARRRLPDGSIELSDNGVTRRWWVLTERDRADAQPEDATLVAIPCDDAGTPMALATEAPSVFCFLPTRDRPGLRMMVHARFPLPVDRERVDVHAPATEAALRRAGQLVCARALALSDPAPLLRLLPLPGEVQPPIWETIRLGFAEAAARQPLLPTPDGARVAPSGARLAPQALAEALAGVDLMPNVRPTFAVIAQDVRTADVLRALDVEEIGPADLFRLIDAHGPDRPAWLGAAAAEMLAAIAAAPDLADWVRRRAADPVAPDDTGTWRPAGALARCPTRLRAFFPHRALLPVGLDADPRLAPIWRAFEVHRLDDHDVAAALKDPTHGPPICAALGPRVLDWMAEQPMRRLAGLHHLAIVPDERGTLGPIADGAPLPGTGPISRWGRRWPDDRAPWIDAAVAASHGSLLGSMGARPFDVDQLLDGDITSMSPEARDDLHGALHAVAGDLTPRQLDRIARSALFVDVQGGARPLRGSGSALVPEHPDLEALLPDSPWLAEGLRQARHVRFIEPTVVGASAVVDGVIDPAAPLGAPVDSPRWRQLTDWIIQHRPPIDQTLRAKATAAPIWASDAGYHPLDALRTPPEAASWARLYADWQRWPAPTAQARALADALGLPGGRPTPPDVVAADFAEMALDRDAWLDAPYVAEAVAALGRTLERDDLLPLARLPIHPDETGLRWPLAGVGEEQGAEPAEDHWRPLLRQRDAVLLDPAWQAATAPFLESLKCDASGIEAALDHADSALELPAALWRAALATDPSWPAALDARVSTLAIWPTGEGGLAAATRVCPPSRLAILPEALAVGITRSLQIDEGAVEHAEALVDRLSFATPIAALITGLTDAAKPGAPLSEQPRWLGTVTAVAAVRRIIRETGRDDEALPIRVDLAGRLTHGPLFAASPDGQMLARPLPIAARVAHPDEHPPEDPPDPPLPARRLLSAIAEAQREEAPPERHPLLNDGEHRQALYRWIAAAADEISDDDQALGQLGRSPIWLTRGGTLRRPRGLLPIDDPLGAVAETEAALDWHPADEVPRAVLDLLRHWFQLDAQHLRIAVDHLIEAHREVGDDVETSARLVGLLARLLTACLSPSTPLAALVARFKLHRRLKIADTDGRFVRPRAVLVPIDPAQGRRVRGFLPEPPPRPHPAYGADVSPLLRAAGAAGDLDDEAVERGLSVPVPGLDAGLARVAYLARRADDEPALVERLALARRPWLFDREGAPCPPSALDWPSPDLDALIGPDGGRRPHPAVVHALPDGLLARLPVRTADDADPRTVAGRLSDGAPIPTVALRWFDAALHDKRITPDQARDALAGRPVFADDDGRCRPPEALVRDLEPPGLGRRRGGFAEGRPVPRLLGALLIPARVDAGVRLAWLDEITADLRRGQDVLATEPALRGLLPAVVGALASEGSERPPVVLAEIGGRPQLRTIGDTRLTWPYPSALLAGAGRTDLPIAVVDAPDAILAESAARWALSTLVDRWTPGATGSEGHPDAETTSILADLWSRLPRVLGRDVAPGPDEPAPTAVTVDDAGHPGTIAGVEVVWPRRARLDRGRVLLEADAEPIHIARALWRDRFDDHRSDDTDDPRVDRIARLVACRHGAAMDLLLDAEGVAADGPARRPPPAPPPKRQQRSPTGGAEPSPPAPEPEATNGPAAETPDDAADDPSLIGRLKRWWRGDEDTTPPEAPSEPARQPPARRRPEPDPAQPAPRPALRPQAEDPGFRAPDTTLYFRPQRAVESQLRANPGWLATRQTPTEIGFAFAPGRLAGVHQYGPALIVDRFDPRSRRWTSATVDPAWSQPPDGGAFRVAFTGRLPTGEAALPVPIYGRVAQIEAEGTRRLQGRDGRPIVVADRPVDVRYTVDLAAAPRYTDAEPPHVVGLLAPTVPDAELPAECHDLVGALLDAPPRARVAGIGQFVRRHYRYDPRYLEDPDHARWLRQVTRGRANIHIAALHAGRDGRHLGAGVCYELNALVCELARRAGIPSAIATGWTFDRGWIDRPDHLWAMALLATDDGPRWLPVDASTTVEGRPLHATPRPPGPHRAQAPRQHRPPPKPVAWTDVAAPDVGTVAPLRELLRVIRHAEQLGKAPSRDEAARLQAARRLLTDPVRARALLAVVESDRDDEGQGT